MRSAVVHVAVGLASLGIASPVFAADGPSEEKSGGRPRFEVTPFIGYRLGGDFDVEGSEADADLDDHTAFGLALNLRLDEVSQYELFYSRQPTRFKADSPVGALDIDVDYLHIGGTLESSEQRRFTPYLAGGLGVTRISPDDAAADDETRFSISLAGGVRVPVTARFGVRLEARGYLTFIDTDSAVFCASGSFGGVCSIRANSSAFFQYEVLAGAAFAF